eukprot:9522702-Alexandrium_andersonii.AAC.1
MVTDCRRSSASRCSRRAISSGEVKMRPSWPSQSQSLRSFLLDIAPSGADLSGTALMSASPSGSSLGSKRA